VVAQDERIGATVIRIDLKGRGLVAVDADEEQASFAPVGRLGASSPAEALAEPLGGPVRVVVEVQRRFGGLAPRALLGGVFTPGLDTDTVFEVDFNRWGEGPAAVCPSRLWKRPFVAGLPEEFAPAVLDGLTDGGPGLPGGVLRVDRAGADEVESSSAVFRQAAAVLRCALAGMLSAEDVEARVRDLMQAW
jgi:hypothetical protein